MYPAGAAPAAPAPPPARREVSPELIQETVAAELKATVDSLIAAQKDHEPLAKKLSEAGEEPDAATNAEAGSAAGGNTPIVSGAPAAFPAVTADPIAARPEAAVSMDVGNAVTNTATSRYMNASET